MTRDNDKFKQLVAEFQRGESRTIIRKIVDYMWLRFDHIDTDNMPEHAMYIAFRINVILAPLLKTAKYNIDQGSYDPEDLWWYAKGLREDLGIELDPSDDFQEVFDNLPAIRRMYGRDVAGALTYSLHRYLTQDSAMDHEFNRIMMRVLPTVVSALEIAVSKADTSRSEREIVRYINRVFQSEYSRIQAEESGAKRLGRRDEDGNYVNVYVQPQDTPVWDTILGLDTSGIDITEAVSKLTPLQRQTILDIHEIVFADFEKGDYSSYKVNEDGKYEIMNRYVAQALDIEESTLRKRRQSIRRALAKEIS